MVERLQATQVKLAAEAVEEVTRASAELAKTRAGEVSRGRIALAAGDRMGWSAVECSAAAAELSRALLATRETAFEAEREALVQVHQAARTELRQIERMVARAGNVAAATAERRAQRASDDRFLARREWLRVERQQSSA